MKMKKVSFLTVVAGIMLISGTTIIFSVLKPKNTEHKADPNDEIDMVCADDTDNGSDVLHMEEPKSMAGADVPENVAITDQNGAQMVSLTVSTGASFKNTDEKEYFEGISGGDKFFYHTLNNRTDKAIVEYEYGMLAYDRNGNPLKAYWNSADSNKLSSYACTARVREAGILPGEDYIGESVFFDADSTWSFMELGAGEEYRIDMVLYCLKEIVFEDGTVWENPNYEDWIENCKGKKIPSDYLWGYYPCEYAIDIAKTDNNNRRSSF